MFRMSAVMLVLGFLCCSWNIAFAQDADLKELQKELREFMDKSVAEHQIRTNTNNSPTKGEIVFRWDNRERGTSTGCTAVWYDESKRPVAIACVYPWQEWLCFYFDLIDRRAGVVGTLNGKTFWKAHDRDAIRFKPLPNAPKPAITERLLRLQLKTLARQFSVKMKGWREDKSDREELRLLTTPVHLYGSKDGDVRAGGIVLFVKGTDPEAALLLEAHKYEDTYRWEYAIMQRTDGALEAKHDGKVIWSKAKDEPVPSHGSSNLRLPSALLEHRQF